jgi:proline racemase
MPRNGERLIQLIDTQSGGDVSRIVLGGIGPLPGTSVDDKMRFLKHEADGLRRLLLYEPHGHPAMCVDLIVEPNDPDAEAGYIIMEAMGYPAFSGSNTVCTVTALLEGGYLPMREGTRPVKLEAPAGPVEATAECRDGRVVSVTCRGDPAYVAERDLTAEVPGYGLVRFDLVWSGCFYAVVRSDELGIEIGPDSVGAMTAFGASFVETVRDDLELVHPELGERGPLSFVHLAGPVEQPARGIRRSRSATYVHPGVLCRSPTGTGTSARLALMVAAGELSDGDHLETVSPRGSVFRGNVLGSAHVGPKEALRTSITARAWTLARSHVVFDLDDPLIEDHGLSRILE